MDRHELNRMFDGLAPGPDRERELLGRLLREDARRKRTMKNWKQAVLAVTAAALLVTAAAAAAPGMSRRLLEYLGVTPEDTETVELLAPGAMAVDVTAEDNGAVLRVTQVLRDRVFVVAAVEFTAPEGTVLKMTPDSEHVMEGSKGFYGTDERCHFMDEAGEDIDLGVYGTYIYDWEILEDEDPLDNHISALFTVKMSQGDRLGRRAASMRMPVGTLMRMDFDADKEEPCFVDVYTGDWSCDVPLPQKDMGWTQRVDCPVGELDGANITVKDLYLSPVNLLVTLGREGGTAFSEGGADLDEEARWVCLLDAKSVTLKGRDGNVLEMGAPNFGSGMIGDRESTNMFRLSEITDPARFQGGTLTLELMGSTITIPLDDLAPVEP